MGVIRVEHNANYTTMANYHLRDRRLSLRAVGLMSKMLSLPEDWDYTVKGLAAICVEGREAVRKVLMELEAAGYLVREQSRGAGGAFSGYDYTLREAPVDPPVDGEAPLPRFPGDGKEAPLPKNPDPGFPVPGFPSQSSTIEPSKQEVIPPYSPPAGDAPQPPAPKKPKAARGEPKTGPDWMPERFAAFWEAYPRGEAKQAAIRAWDKLRPDNDLLTSMAKGLRRQLQSEDWKANIGIPYASTWLNQRRWTDTVKKPIDQTPAADSRGEVGDRW